MTRGNTPAQVWGAWLCPHTWAPKLRPQLYDPIARISRPMLSMSMKLKAECARRRCCRKADKFKPPSSPLSTNQVCVHSGDVHGGKGRCLSIQTPSWSQGAARACAHSCFSGWYSGNPQNLSPCPRISPRLLRSEEILGLLAMTVTRTH